MVLSVHQPQYLPWLGFFDKLAKSESFVFLDNVQYKPREFQNRNKIKAKDSSLWLTVPVVTKGHARQRISDARIDNSFPWMRQHLKSMQSWYARADHYHEYISYFEGLYSRRWDWLAELNEEIIRFIQRELCISTRIYYESQLNAAGARSQRIINICKELKADTYLSGSGGKDYLDEGLFRKEGIKLIYQDFRHPVYRQQFIKTDSDFIPGLSIVDLLFNEGRKSRAILKI